MVNTTIKITQETLAILKKIRDEKHLDSYDSVLKLYYGVGKEDLQIIKKEDIENDKTNNQ